MYMFSKMTYSENIVALTSPVLPHYNTKRKLCLSHVDNSDKMNI
jgi:hypothetical protein